MINTVSEINFAAKDPAALIKAAEDSYKAEVYAAAERIALDDNIKIVALAGPSGSGKTTSAHILCERLRELGEEPVVVSLDNFYLEKKDLPLLPNGGYDTESVASLDVPLINKCFKEIIKTGKASLPRYDFGADKSILNDRTVDISNHGIVIVEGLHALNTLITDLVPRKNIFKIYISVNCSINDDFGEQLLSSRQIRLARRSIRDSIFRDTDINETMAFWDAVIDGEREHLYPFKKTADIWLKTLHIFEPCVYRNSFLKFRDEIDPKKWGYEYFMRVANALEKFVPIDPIFVPENSLIREFIGK